LERALVAMFQAMTSDARPQPNFGTPREDEAERMKSGSAGKEHGRTENENERLESKNE
jgi:hypothetical protein